MPYRSEQDFAAALVTGLRHYPILVQRIESAVTNVGIPDLYIRGKQELWIELKNSKYSVYDIQWTIEWRKGQQAWALEYLRASGRCSYTVCALKDGFIIIPMQHRYTGNVVKNDEVIKMTALKDVVNEIIKAIS